MKLRRIGSVLVPVVLALAPLACSAEVSTNPPPPPPPAEGTLIVDWTIDGGKDPNACNQSVSAAIDIRIHDAGGGFVGEFQQACDAFATSITLAAGSYTATAVLVDGGGNVRTTIIDVNPFTIQGADQLTIPIDFPANAFR